MDFIKLALEEIGELQFVGGIPTTVCGTSLEVSRKSDGEVGANGELTLSSRLSRL